MKMLINGEWIDKKQKIDVVNPYNQKVVDTVPSASAEDVDNAIKCAAKYDHHLTPADRYEILHNFCHLLKEKEKDFIELISSEIGKTLKESTVEMERAYQTFIFSAEEAKRINGELLPVDAIKGHSHRFGLVIREPIGIIAAITPFNYPLNLVAHKIGPAIASNNPVILKPSRHAPLTALKAAELLLASGLPKEMLQVITGDSKDIADPLILNDLVKLVTFTGSVAAGKAICQKAGLKKVSMELGGNCPLVILEDADMAKAVDFSVKGAFGNNGQRCTSTKRIIVQESVADKFVQMFIDAAKKLRVGDPTDPSTDIGPLISEKAVLRVGEQVKTAVSAGARMRLGGQHEGPIYLPTVLDDLKRDNPIIKEEVFGPVVSFRRIKDLKAAIDACNDTQYGLQAGIFTNDINKAFEFARHVDAGGVMINDVPGFRAEHIPFGGVKDSGIGREGVRYAIEGMTRLKTIVV